MGFFFHFSSLYPYPIHWIACVLAYLNFIFEFIAVLVLPKTASSAQTHKSMSFIWIVWSTLYVYLWFECETWNQNFEWTKLALTNNCNWRVKFAFLIEQRVIVSFCKRFVWVWIIWSAFHSGPITNFGIHSYEKILIWCQYMKHGWAKNRTIIAKSVPCQQPILNLPFFEKFKRMQNSYFWLIINSIFPFFNWELFDLRKICVLNLKTGRP